MDILSTLPALLSWAVSISGYAPPQEAPALEFKPHSFFVENVCGNKECNALGWYNNEGIIYIDQKFEHGNSDFASTLIVHEIVHYLQDVHSANQEPTCQQTLAREAEAYRVQNLFIVKAHLNVGLVHAPPAFCQDDKMKIEDFRQ